MSTNKNAGKLLKSVIGKLSFGSFLRVSRKSMGLSQVEMAKRLKVSKSVICDIEKGRQAVSITLAVKIAKSADLSQQMAIKLCLQDQLNKANIKMKVDLKKAA